MKPVEVEEQCGECHLLRIARTVLTVVTTELVTATLTIPIPRAPHYSLLLYQGLFLISQFRSRDSEKLRNFPQVIQENQFSHRPGYDTLLSNQMPRQMEGIPSLPSFLVSSFLRQAHWTKPLLSNFLPLLGLASCARKENLEQPSMGLASPSMSVLLGCICVYIYTHLYHNIYVYTCI